LRPIYQRCRALTFALARLSCYLLAYNSFFVFVTISLILNDALLYD